MDSMKYVDEEGDWCTLVEATFTDFLETAQAAAGGRKIVKVDVEASSLSPAPELFEAIKMQNEELRQRRHAITTREDRHEDLASHAEKGDPDHKCEMATDMQEIDTGEAVGDGFAADFAIVDKASDEETALGEDWEFVEHSHTLAESQPSSAQEASEPFKVKAEPEDEMMREIREELERIKAACEAELERHLDEWLPTIKETLRYESWIAAVHPENVKGKSDDGPIIDERMYLAGSFHRQLWNSKTSGLDGLSESTKQCCFVVPR